MSLPETWTNKIFDKMTLIYGRDFAARWEGMQIADVKADWSHELSGYENRPKAISWALQNLPVGKPPTVLEFRKLANTLPQEATVFLDAPRADPARVQHELSKLSAAPAKTDGREWARRIISRKEQGELINPAALTMAKAALE